MANMSGEGGLLKPWRPETPRDQDILGFDDSLRANVRPNGGRGGKLVYPPYKTLRIKKSENDHVSLAAQIFEFEALLL